MIGTCAAGIITKGLIFCGIQQVTPEPSHGRRGGGEYTRYMPVMEQKVFHFTLIIQFIQEDEQKKKQSEKKISRLIKKVRTIRPKKQLYAGNYHRLILPLMLAESRKMDHPLPVQMNQGGKSSLSIPINVYQAGSQAVYIPISKHILLSPEDLSILID